MSDPKRDQCSYCNRDACAWIIVPWINKRMPGYEVAACFEHEQSPNFKANETVAKARVGARIIRKIRSTEHV